MHYIVIWEMFVVEIFLWGRQTTKIKHTNIYVQQTFRVFNFVGFHNPQKCLTQKLYTHMKNLTQKFPNYSIVLNVSDTKLIRVSCCSNAVNNTCRKLLVPEIRNDSGGQRAYSN